MKCLILTVGEVSGIAASLCEAFRRKGIEVQLLDAAECIHPVKEGRLGISSFSPSKLLNGILALSQFGKNWKKYFIRTTYAFRKMSAYATRFQRERNCDFILQIGCLFGLEKNNLEIPYYLYLDHTYALSANYPVAHGLDSAAIATMKWEAHERKTYERSNHIFCLSRNVRKSLLEEYGIDEGKISVIGAGPNVQVKSNLDRNRFQNQKILFVGIDFLRKGGWQLINAFRSVREKYPNATLNIIGPKLNLDEENIFISETLDPEVLSRMYAESSMFVMPTLREPFGLVFLEAMAHGLPCIGSNIEAVPEIIEDQVSGYLVEPGNVDDLADNMIRMLESPQQMMEMGLRGQMRIEEKYNWDSVVEQILKVAVTESAIAAE